MHRRQFLATSATAALGFPGSAAAAAPEPWFDKPMRWAQMVFVEDDPGNYDPKFWLDYFRRIHADGACLAGGGYMAFYPTRVPFHYKSRFMKAGMDPLGELVKGCRELGMAVIARTDPHAMHPDAAEAHPDWISVNAKGEKVRHWADPRLWVSCTLGPYNWEFMTAVTREIVDLYKIDGIFCNRWEGPSICYCEHCTRNFRSATGLDLPRNLVPSDKGYRAYLEWRENRFFDLWKLWDREIMAANPNARFIPNTGGAERLLDMDRIGEMSSILFYDRQARRGNPAWFNGRFAKEYRSTLGRKPIGAIASVGHEDAYRWKDSVQSPAEVQLFLHEGIANGARPWVAKFNGKIIDRRWLKPVEEVYTWAWKNERWLRNEESLAETAIVYSQQTVHHYAGDNVKDKYDDGLSGMYHALVESRIPFEMVHDHRLAAAQVDRYKTLILPNVAALSDAQCDQLTSYVERGGSLVATFETSLYDEWGQRRKNFGLSRLFGCDFGGTVQRRMQNSYLTLEHETRHPLLKGLEDAPRIINGTRRVATTPHDREYRAPITLVPTYPDLPMEEVYPRADSKTTQPEVYVRQFGKGRVIYFPFDLERTFQEVMSIDHLRLLRNTFDYAAAPAGGHPVVVTGPGLVDVTYFRQKGSFTVHLVNLTNPMFMRGPLREVIPVGPQTVQIRFPRKGAVSTVKLLTAGNTVRVTWSNNILTVRVPSVSIHEVIALSQL